MKNLKKATKDMTIEEQVALLSRVLPNFENRTLRALSSSGIIWIDQDSQEAFEIKDSKNVKLLNPQVA